MKTVVAAVDLTPSSERVVAVAAELARGLGAKLYLLHVAAEEPSFVGFDVGPQYVRDAEAERLTAEHRELDEIDRRLEAQGLAVTSYMWRGHVVEKILALCDRVSADLLVIGPRSRSPLTDVLLGSAANDVLRRAKCPVVVASPRAI
jgi:nucleotide-binding universal stress UspA family protein